MGQWSNLIKINDDKIQINYDLREMQVSEDTFSLKNMPLIGEHNFKNYICAILAAKTAGVAIEDSISSLLKFQGVKRRLELTPKFVAKEEYMAHAQLISPSSSKNQ